MNDQSKTLTHRSVLNTIGALLVYVVYLGSSFISKKYLVLFLGPISFGAWEICFRLLNYVSPGEGPVSQTLKGVLANKHTVVGPTGLRRYVGAAFFLWALLVVPIFLIGSTVAWFSPRFISNLPLDLIPVIRWTSLIIVIGLLVETWSRLYLSALQGINLLYKATWATSSIHVLGMILMISAAYLGFGLPGMAFSLIIMGLTSGIVYLKMVRLWIPWFGLEKPHKEDVKKLLTLGSWMYLWSFISRLLFLSDLVILGMVKGALSVTSLTFTQYAPHVGIYLAAMATNAVAPGLGQLFGKNKFLKIKEVREELAAILWLVIIVTGVCVLAWNETLVRLWVGSDKFAGSTVNFLLVLILAQMAYIRMDAFIIDVSLKVRKKVFWGLFSAVISIILAYLLGKKWETTGVLIGLLLGRGILTIVYPRLISQLIKKRENPVAAISLIRVSIVSMAMLLTTQYFAAKISGVGWVGLFCFGFVTVVIAFFIAFFVGFNKQIRKRLWIRISHTGVLNIFTKKKNPQ